MNTKRFFSLIIAGLLFLVTPRAEATTVGGFIQQGFVDLAGPIAQGIGGGMVFTSGSFVAQASGQIHESKIWTTTLEFGGWWYVVGPVYVGARGGLVLYHDGRTELPDNRWRPLTVFSIGGSGLFTGETVAHDLQFDLGLLPARKEGGNPGLGVWARYCYRLKVGK